MTIDELKELLKKFDSSITYKADLIKKNWCKIKNKNFKGWIKKESLWGLL